jgi:hypothetical protein
VSEGHDALIARAIRRAADAVVPVTFAEVVARGHVPDASIDDGEPVPEAAAHPRDGAPTGGPVMVIDLEREQEAFGRPERPDRQHRRWPLVAAAAAVVVLVAIGVGVAADGDRVELAPAEDPADGSLAARTERVDEFVQAYNAGDPSAVAEWFAPSDQPIEPAKLADPAFQAAGDRWTRTGPCRQGGGEDVVCPIRREDDFHGAVGLSIEEDHVFRFDGDLLDRLVLLEADPWDDAHAFRADFRRWVADEHPDARIRWFPPVGSYSDELADMPTAESMPEALELVDDFVARSDRSGG